MLLKRNPTVKNSSLQLVYYQYGKNQYTAIKIDQSTNSHEQILYRMLSRHDSSTIQIYVLGNE